MSVLWKCRNTANCLRVIRISSSWLIRWISQAQHKKLRRVVITGIGVICPLGCGLQKSWDTLLEGKSGIIQLTGDEYKGISCKIAGMVPRGSLPGQLNLESSFSKSEIRTLSLSSLFALVAANEALKDSSLKIETDDDKKKIGVAFGAGMPDLEEIHSVKSLNRISPHFVTRILPNMPAGHVSSSYKLWGPNLSTSTACASGSHAIGDAFRAIKYGEADAMVCGGTEAPISPLSLAAFGRIRALTSHTDPSQASRPFDAKRDGFVMAEGAAAIVLEELEHAVSRCAPKIYAEMVGYGRSSDAGPATAPHPEGAGAIRAMEAALEEAGIEPEKVGYVNAHATSTPLGDAAESKAISRLLNNACVSSTKGAHGHLLGAAGALESVFTIMTVSTGVIPHTLNLEVVGDDVAKLDFVMGSKRKWDNNPSNRVALKNSFGFGGTNASLCFIGWPSKV